jgi:hypothetical protein
LIPIHPIGIDIVAKHTSRDSNPVNEYVCRRLAIVLATLRSTSNDRNSQLSCFSGVICRIRFDAHSGREFDVALNTSTTTNTNQMEVDPNSQHFAALIGERRRSTAPGTYRVRISALDFIACEAGASQ